MLIATVTGNVGSSELKDVRGKARLEFSVASNEKDKDGKDTTTWVRCTLWERRATALAPYVIKGTNLTVVGKLTTRAYQKRNGSRGFSLEMAVSELALQGGKRDGSSSGKRESAPQSDHDTAKANGHAPDGGSGTGEYTDDDYGTGPDGDDIPF